MQQVAIVDDVEDSREFLLYLLRDSYVVRPYESGESALKMLPENLPDIVILDISLRDMDGIDVLKALRSEPSTSRIPVIALTAHAMAGDREKFLAAGFDDYISKPIMDVEIVLSAIRR